jgi:hypothetical protein
MRERFPSSRCFGEDQYSSTFIAAVVSDNQIFFTWIGSQQAKLFRRRSCIKTTVPHAIVVRRPDQKPFVITNKALSTIPDQAGNLVTIEGPWSLSLGDTLVIADNRLFSLGSDDEITTAITNLPMTPARALVEWAQGVQFHYVQSAMVVRFDER